MATMLESVKARCGIPASVTVYDSEYQSLIDDCIEEMRTAGVPASLLSSDNVNQRVLTCIVLYVKSMQREMTGLIRKNILICITRKSSNFLLNLYRRCRNVYFYFTSRYR